MVQAMQAILPSKLHKRCFAYTFYLTDPETLRPDDSSNFLTAERRR